MAVATSFTKSLHKSTILMKKRLAYRKNLLFQRHDESIINLLDFRSMEDLILWEPYNDRNQYGGISTYNIKHEDESVRIFGDLVKHGESKLLLDSLFSGITCYHFILRQYSYPGLRIQIKTNNVPIKLTLYCSSDLISYDSYSWFIFDDSNEFRSYEIPISNLVDDTIHRSTGNLVKLNTTESISLRCLSVVAQSTKEMSYNYSIK